MDVRRMQLATPCPACGVRDLLYTAMQLDIPYFGQVVETLIVCGACGFKHADVITGQAHEPLRYTLEVRRAEDLVARVVRSTSGTVRIPQLGVLIEPGAASEAYVSNVEGVLVRVERVLIQLERDAEDDEQRKRIQERLAQLGAARDGSLPFTLILEDPHGNSVIGHEAAIREALTPQEAEKLARGEHTLEFADLAGNGSGGPTSP